ncbi:proline-rich protein 27 [Sus scrofa]|uniref:proline-rich protein 27 n=1 Tax=Sus scrofa TaxID=9823 RepID=UPI000A2B1BA4|nr:proline-rich protein 27 [Sus scrofa]
MKLLLWACLMYVASAKDHKDIHGRRYPINPSLDIIYPMPESEFTPPVSPPRKNLPHYPGNPDPDTGIPPYAWILGAPGAPLYRIPNFPMPSWLSRHPPPGGAFSHVPSSSRSRGPFLPDEKVIPTAAELYIAMPLAPPTTPPPTIPDLALPAVTEPDEAEPAAAPLRP